MNYADLIKQIDFELSSICNAVCPVCPRRIDGRLTDFTQSYYSLEEVKRILDENIVKNLHVFNICGNYGDAMANPEIVEIIDWIRRVNPHCKIDLKTNGGLGTQDQFKRLAELKVNIRFGIDGLGEVNELYRVNVKWKKLLENVLAFSSAAEPQQMSIQFLLWAETVDQIIPMIDFATSINCGNFYLRKPFVASPEHTEVFNLKTESTHFLTQVEFFDGLGQIMETQWRRADFEKLKKIVRDFNLKVKKLKLSDKRIGQTFNIQSDDRRLEDVLELDESEQLQTKKQTCLSKNALNPENIKENWYNIYITHNNLIMPCCMIPPFIMSPPGNLSNREVNSRIEILNKIDEIGRENFSLKNKSLRELMNSGVIHKFIYDDLEKDKSLGFCKTTCGKCN